MLKYKNQVIFVMKRRQIDLNIEKLHFTKKDILINKHSDLVGFVA